VHEKLYNVYAVVYILKKKKLFLENKFATQDAK